MTIRFDGRVAIVTGAGNGLGRAHALGLASRGAKVVVNDFGGARDGTGGSLTPAETVVEEIRKAGGTAMADGADVSNYEQVKAMVARATKEWGSVDLLCANAGILRDKSFAKMEIADFAKVIDVHLTGTFYCCKAVWDGMRERNYGRIVITTSSSGLYGNFGQANYGAAKAGMVGLMNVLAEEGRKNNIRVNTISPTAATRMTEELLPPQALGADAAGSDHAGGRIPAQRGRADPHHHGRRRGLLRGDQGHGKRGHQPRPVRLDPRRGRGAFRRDQRHGERRRRCKARSSRPRNMSARPRRGRGSSCRAACSFRGRCAACELEGWRNCTLAAILRDAVHVKTRVLRMTMTTAMGRASGLHSLQCPQTQSRRHRRRPRRPDGGRGAGAGRRRRHRL